ncbi:hypothetical protein [Pseudomonas guariconensis]|jgi:hypothetical protein|uniref:hypothetical protein n=1 Tax=Pseudomonas guariconensis TaxID=1288410 RepID=UPI0036F1DFF7
MTQYYPKAGRCRGCEKVSANCSSLDFASMPVHRRDGADVVVICTEFRQVNRADSLKEHVRRGRGA